RAGGAFLHDGRQPPPVARQPLPQRRWLCAVRERDRPRAGGLLLGRRGREPVACVEMAVVGALEPARHAGAVADRPRAQFASRSRLTISRMISLVPSRSLWTP